MPAGVDFRACRRDSDSNPATGPAVRERSQSSRREFLRTGGLSAAAAASRARVAAQRRESGSAALNVLLVLVDDLRTELGCYGSARVKSPHIDRLAEGGLTFLRSYCQQAASAPSLASLLTGLRPDTTRVYDHTTHFRRTLPSAVTLPEHFKRHGYRTTAFGGILDRPAMDDLPSWSIAPWTPGAPSWRSEQAREEARSRWDRLRAGGWRMDSTEPSAEPGPSWTRWDGDEAELEDSQVVRQAAEAMASMKDDRFLIAVGLRGPGLPFVAPDRYFGLYPRGSWGPPQAPEPPRDAPSFALHGSEEIRAYADIPSEGPIGEEKGRQLIRAYRACVSFTDDQIGVLLDALADLGLAENTVVAVAGVSGSHLGELGLWNKNSNYEAATHAPLVVRAPGQLNAGRKTSALVESVDLFPSLCSVCRIPFPSNREGSSWRGLFDDPKRLWKRAVFSQHPRIIPGVGAGMGYSMRTARHRYTEWSGLESPYSTAELYDYKESRYELRNIANRPEHGSLVNGLAHMLREGWRGSLPPPELPTSSRA